ncbi:MAG: N-formylglutamate amidohydrolase [Candidatus Adiutrix sp.]|jgi:hypothetical protein|nr:N-formylglutamate amidohydrolase [Candidatus Adiutrix sp.]
MNAVVINLPYAGGGAPPPVAKHLNLAPGEWQLEHWRLTDPCLAEVLRLAAAPEARPPRPVVVNPWSPLVADPWGLWAAELASAGDQPEPGGAAILSRTTAGKAITWTEAEREVIFGRSVRPFYAQIEAAVAEMLQIAPLVLVITLRSYSSRPFAFERNRKFPRPQVCVGARSGLTPPGLADLAGDVFLACRWWPELSWPQAGGACLPPSLAGRPRVRALGLSLCRSLYMDEDTGRPKPAAAGVARVLSTVFNILDQELSRVSQLRLDRARPKDSPVIKANQL